MWKPTIDDGAKTPAFRQIAQSIANDVATGRLAVGAQLPPHRDLADELGIARGTVARAYREAERIGLVRSEVGRGTRVLGPDAGERAYSSLFEEPTALSDLSTNLPLSGIDPDPGDALRALAERPDRRVLLRYQSPVGLRRHRLAGVRWFERMGIAVAVDRVFLTAGAQHALFVIFAHLRARAPAIYVEELTYPGMHGIAEALGVPLVPVAMDANGIDIADLERAVRRHGPGTIYTMPTIHNPTGIVMPEARRRELASLARERDLFLVEDEANRMFVADAPAPLFTYAPERSFCVASVSKVLSPGLRVAFVAAPEADVAALGRLVWASHWMVSPIGAEIVAMWLDDGTVDRTIDGKRRESVRRQNAARRIFGRDLVAHPKAMHVWLTLPQGTRAERFANAAAAQNIVVTPSTAFWSRTTPPPRAIRLALGGVDSLRALTRDLTAIAGLIEGCGAA